MVKEEKINAIKMLKEKIEKSPVIGLVDLHKMPSKQMQEIRKTLRGKAKIEVVKKVVLKFAVDGVKRENIKELEQLMPKQPTIILSDMGAFKLYALLDKLRFKTFAKSGDVANEDIWVYAGPTSLMAGPAISELQQAGVPASIESGKIAVRKDVCIVKKGEAITAVKANVLRKLKIEPMEVLLNIVAVYENGDVYNKGVLELATKYPKMLSEAFNNALNLSVTVVFPTKESIKHLLAKASQNAKAISGLVDKGRGKDEGKVEVKENIAATTETAKDEDVKSGGEG